MIALHQLLSLEAPEWAVDDESDGWQGKSGFRDSVNATLIRSGVRADDPEAVRVAYVYKGEEFVSEVLPPGSNADEAVERLVGNVVVPISEVRVYHGASLYQRRVLRLRGA